MKKSNDTLGNRTRVLSACSTVLQPTALPHAPVAAVVVVVVVVVVVIIIIIIVVVVVVVVVIRKKQYAFHPVKGEAFP